MRLNSFQLLKNQLQALWLPQKGNVKDLLAASCSQTAKKPLGVLARAIPSDLSQLDAAAIYLSWSQQPMILLGEGARVAKDSIIETATLLDAGIIESLGAKGTIPADHPHHIGSLGDGGTKESQQLLMQSDCVLVIGANWWPQGYVPQMTQVIHIDINPASIEGHQLVTCGLVGQAEMILPSLNQIIDDQQKVRGIQPDKWRNTVINQAASIKQKLQAEGEELYGEESHNHANHPQLNSSSQQRLRPQQIMSTLDQLVKDDAIIALDTGDHTLWFNRNFKARSQSVLYSGKWRTMGYALPAAIAVQIIYPDRQVIALMGDLGLSMTMMELATAVRHQLPISIIVFKKSSWLRILAIFIVVLSASTLNILDMSCISYW